jgi:hypothetical protein
MGCDSAIDGTAKISFLINSSGSAAPPQDTASHACNTANLFTLVKMGSHTVSEPASPQAASAELAPQAVPAAVTATGTGITFQFTYNSVDYNVQVYAPDSHGQYGFTVTEAPTTAGGTTTTVASLVYAPVTATNTTEGWEIQVTLPKALQVDSNLTVNTLTVDITKGSVQALG